MAKKKNDLKWDKLDNTANVFPVIAGEGMSNVYRISVTLKEEVDPELLQQALERVLPWFDGFRVRLLPGSTRRIIIPINIYRPTRIAAISSG